ncbi:MAG: hypothetical protein WBW04_21130 [Nitrolancea sp.]
MADDKRTGQSDSGEPTAGDMTVVTVPANNVQEVLDFVAGLEKEEADVSGHMISGGALGSFGGGLAAKGGRSLTGCNTTGGTEFPDWQCSDLDR